MHYVQQIAVGTGQFMRSVQPSRNVRHYPDSNGVVDSAVGTGGDYIQQRAGIYPIHDQVRNTPFGPKFPYRTHVWVDDARRDSCLIEQYALKFAVPDHFFDGCFQCNKALGWCTYSARGPNSTHTTRTHRHEQLVPPEDVSRS